MQRSLLYIFAVAGNLLLGVLLLPFSASALTVSPARIEITVDPGQTATGEIELFNEQDTQKTFFTSYENFEPRGDSGTPYFIGAKDGLATWIEAAEEVTLAVGERKIVEYAITVPKNTQPGGYFAAIFFGTQPQKGARGGEVTIGGKIGVLLLLRVSGEIEEAGGLVDFQAPEGQRFFTALPVTLEYRLNNTGGDRVVPLGDIKIKNTFRGRSETLLANKNEGSVLPGSTRKFSVIWGDEEEDTKIGDLTFFGAVKKQWEDIHFGWYTAQLDLVWGQTNQSAQKNYHFFILPWQLLSLILIILIIIFILGRTGLRRYNRFIIAQAARARAHK